MRPRSSMSMSAGLTSMGSDANKEASTPAPGVSFATSAAAAAGPFGCAGAGAGDGFGLASPSAAVTGQDSGAAETSAARAAIAGRSLVETGERVGNSRVMASGWVGSQGSGVRGRESGVGSQGFDPVLALLLAFGV